MSVMQRADFRRELQLGLYGTFGMNYDDWSEEWTQIYEEDKSEKAYEEEVKLVGLGVAEQTPESTAITFDGGGEAWVQRYNHIKVTKAFEVTEEAVDDNLYHNVSTLYAKSAARAMRVREEVDGAAIINNGYNTTYYVGGDQVSLFNTGHPLSGPNGGTQANTFLTQADLSDDSLQDLINIIGRWTDDRGMPIKIMPNRLSVPIEMNFVAQRILHSDLRSDTVNNDLNVHKDMRTIPEGHSVNHYYSDPDQWQIITDADQGFRHFERKAVKKSTFYQFTTGNLQVKFVKRYSFGFTDWRTSAGSSGSAV